MARNQIDNYQGFEVSDIEEPEMEGFKMEEPDIYQGFEAANIEEPTAQVESNQFETITEPVSVQPEQAPEQSAWETTKDIGRVYPVAETAATFATSSYGIPLSGLWGLLHLPFGADEAAEAVEEAQRLLVYQPQTERGKALAETASYPFEKLHEVGKFVGEKVQDVTGSETAAALASAAIETGPFVFPMLKAGKRMGKVMREQKLAKEAIKIQEKASVRQAYDQLLDSVMETENWIDYEKDILTREMSRMKDEMRRMEKSGQTDTESYIATREAFSQAADELSATNPVGENYERFVLELEKMSDEPFQFEKPISEIRFQKARSTLAKNSLERLKDWAVDTAVSLKNKATREYEYLPKDRRFAPLRNELLKLSKQKAIASDKAARIIYDTVGNLDKDQYDMFTRKVVLEDIKEDLIRKAEKTEQQVIDFETGEVRQPDIVGPFEFRLEDVNRELNRVNKRLDPTIEQSLTKREAHWDILKNEYISAMDEIGFNVRDRLSRENYFRRQVIDFLDAKNMIKGAGERLRSPTYRSFLKERKGTRDFLTDYIDSENQVMAQMAYDIELAKTIKKVKDTYDVKSRVQRDMAKAIEKGEFEPEIDAKTGEYKPDQWKRFMRENDKYRERFTIWQPREGHAFFLTDSISSQLLESLFNDQLERMGVTREVIKKNLAVGKAYNELVVPIEVANTLNNLVHNKSTNPILQAHRKILKAWKIYTLTQPKRAFKYNLRNLSGDAEASMIGNWQAIRKIPQAIRDINAARLTKGVLERDPILADYIGWLERGGEQATLAAQEIGALNKLQDQLSKSFEKMGTPTERAVDFAVNNVWKKYWKAARLATDTREGILRYANYLEYLDQMKNDTTGKGRPKNFGASIPEEVIALKDIKDRAYWLSNELLGAYDRVSVGGQALRENLFPFWCVPEHTEILTKSGWKKYHELEIGEMVLTYNIEERKTEWQPVEDIGVFDFDGDLVNLYNKWGTNFEFTKEHEIPIIQRYKDRSKIVKAEELKTHHKIPVVAEHKFTEENILSEKEASLLGWIITDGYHRWRANNLEAVIYQSPKKHADKIRELFKGWITSESIHPDTGVICFRISDDALTNIKKIFTSTKDVSNIVCRLNKKSLQAMYNAMLDAEATTTDTFISFTQEDEDVMNAFQIICYLLGKAFNIRDRKHNGFSKKTTIPMGYVKKRDKLSLYKWKIGTKNYKGKVWCPTTDNHTWIMRQNGHVLITGNSWKEVNAVRYKRLFQNAINDGRTAEIVGKSLLAKGLNPMTYVRVGKFTMKAIAFWSVLQWYNNTFHPEKEKKLPDHVRHSTHIILGKDKEGDTEYFNRIGTLSDLLEWVGLDTALEHWEDYTKHGKSISEIAKDMAIEAPKSFINTAAQGSEPFMKFAGEWITRRELFPDIWRPGVVRDRWNHLFKFLGFEDEAKALLGRPVRKDIAKKWFLYESDPEESAYHEALKDKFQWLKDRGKGADGFFLTKKGSALYNARLSLRYGDQKLAAKYMEDYLRLGGKLRGIRQSFERMDPLSGMTDEEKIEYVKTLDPDKKEVLKRAFLYYKSLMMVGEKEK